MGHNLDLLDLLATAMGALVGFYSGWIVRGLWQVWLNGSNRRTKGGTDGQ